MRILAQFLILLVTTGRTFCGGPANCVDLQRKFMLFEEAWLDLVNDIQGFVMNSSSSYPIFTSALIIDLICESNLALGFAANATNRLSRIDSDFILDILKGNLSVPYYSQVDCIADDLVYMRDKIEDIFKNVVPLLEASVPQSSVSIDSCFSVYISMVSNAPAGISIAKVKGELFADALKAFTSIGMEDLYLASLGSADCLWNIVGTGLGNMYNSNPNSITNYLNGTSTELDYPYNCIQNLIDLLKFSLTKAMDNLIAGKPMNLYVPSVPNFQFPNFD